MSPPRPPGGDAGRMRRVDRLRQTGMELVRRLGRLGRETGGRLAKVRWDLAGLWTAGTVLTVLVAGLLFLLVVDWNWFKGPASRMASAATGRRIEILGDLSVRLWSTTPQVTVEGLRIGNRAPFHARAPLADIGRATVAVRLLPLLIGRIEVVRLDLAGARISLFRTADGIANWERGKSADAPDLPPVSQFSLRDGHLDFSDARRGLELNAAFSTDEAARGFRLAGTGTLERRPFALEFAGAPLLNVRRDRPYDFRAIVTAGATHITARGAILHPFNLAAWRADIDASGDDLARLYDVTGIVLPNSPPYRLRGRIERNGQVYAMPAVAGRVGDSDLAGAFTARRQANQRLLLTGSFRSRDLDFDDMLAVLGGAPSVAAHETASPTQRAEARTLASEGRLLPDARLDIRRVRNMDAQVSYRAAHVRSPKLPLQAFSVDVRLKDGVLRLDPLELDLRQGRLAGAVTLDARPATPRVSLDLRLAKARIETFFMTADRAPVSGPLLGRLRLAGSGASVRQAAATMDGQITLVTPRGEVREAFAELTGINVTRGLGLLLTGDKSSIGVRCGVANFDVRQGVARARTVVFDTDTMLIQGGGSVDLRDESLALLIKGKPKEPRLVRVAAPIEIQGRLRSPKVGVSVRDAVDQGGVAALLASLVAPVAALLPFVDAGLAKDADCAALMSSAATKTE